MPYPLSLSLNNTHCPSLYNTCYSSLWGTHTMSTALNFYHSLSLFLTHPCYKSLTDVHSLSLSLSLSLTLSLSFGSTHNLSLSLNRRHSSTTALVNQTVAKMVDLIEHFHRVNCPEKILSFSTIFYFRNRIDVLLWRRLARFWCTMSQFNQCDFICPDCWDIALLRSDDEMLPH